MTWDGKISTRNKTRSDFSSKRDKHRLLEIRTMGDAVLVGKNTVEKENMSMGLPDSALREERVRRGKAAYPIRVIVTNSGRINPALPLFAKTFSPVLIYSTKRMPARTRAALGAAATIYGSRSATINLLEMLRHLRREHRVKCLVCEGGPTLLRGLLECGAVDELYLTLCPRIFGGSAAPTLTGLPGEFLPHSVQGRLVSMEVHEGECFLHYRLAAQRK